MKNSTQNLLKPCIRGLKAFEKKGCPQRGWEEGGCPAWREMIIPTRAQPNKKENRAQCLDQWYFDFQWSALGLLEGNQQATESFRNSMTDQKGPRPDPALMSLVKIVQLNYRQGGRPLNELSRTDLLRVGQPGEE